MLIRSILLVVSAAATAAAQTATLESSTPSWAPPPGTHIRGYVLRPDSTSINGWIVRYDGVFAAISSCARCDDARWVPIDSVRLLEAAHGTARYRGSRFVKFVAKATGIGAAAGLGFGVFLAVRGRCNCDGFDLLQIPTAAVMGTGVGLLAGVVSGLVAGKESWAPVRRP